MNAPIGEHVAQWMLSHLEEEKSRAKREKAIRTGLIVEEDIEGNVQADVLAKQGAEMHRDTSEYRDKSADLRAITVAAQRLYLHIWNQHLGQETQSVRDMAEQDAEELDHVQQNMLYDAGDDQYDYDPFCDEDQLQGGDLAQDGESTPSNTGAGCISPPVGRDSQRGRGGTYG